MTEDELENLADLIVDKIIKRQAEYDAEFMQQLKESSEENDLKFLFLGFIKFFINVDLPAPGVPSKTIPNLS